VARVAKICRVLRLAFFFPSLFPLSFSVPEATLAHFQSIILIFFFQIWFLLFFIDIYFILDYP